MCICVRACVDARRDSLMIMRRAGSASHRKRNEDATLRESETGIRGYTGYTKRMATHCTDSILLRF